MNRKWIIGLGIGAISIISSLYGVWYWQATVLRENVVSQLTIAKKLGFDISYDRINPTGFPLSIGISIKNLEINRKNDFIFTSKIEGALNLTHSLITHKQTAAIIGTHSLQLPPLFTHKPLLIKHSGAADLESSSTGVPSGVALNLKDVDISGIQSPWRAQDATIGLKAPENWQLNLSSSDFNASFILHLNRLTIDNLPLSAELPHTLDHFVLEGSYKGPILTTTFSQDFIKKWYKSSGAIEIKTLEAKWGKFLGSANATLVLDANLQPTIAGVMKARGINEMLDDLATAKVISSQQLIQAKAAIELVKAITSQKDSANIAPSDELSLPITLQDGLLTIGNFDVMNVGKIEWVNP